jgi:YHS domain-containing protein
MSPLKLLLLAVLIFITYKLFTGRAAIKEKDKQSEAKGKTEDESVELVQDPISGLYIDKDTNYKVKYYDKVYYFASQENMDKFISEKKGE